MNKICNSVMEVPGGIELNEKDYCSCLLMTLKDIEKNYVVAMTEASNNRLYNIYKETFIKMSDLQRKLYMLMFKNGWYQFETVTDSKLSDKYTSLEGKYKRLSE